LTGKEWQQILQVGNSRPSRSTSSSLSTYETLFLNLQYLPFSLPYFLCYLKDYWEKHPEVTVLDPPAAIQHLYNRQSMLQDVANLNLSDCYGKFVIA
ncbi:hypothetical protein BHE74_00045155, partial [Ensete ventricosum]